jgi:hypothetical protein
MIREGILKTVCFAAGVALAVSVMILPLFLKESS